MKKHKHHFGRRETKAILISALAAATVCHLAACADQGEIPELPTESLVVEKDYVADYFDKATENTVPSPIETTTSMPAAETEQTTTAEAPKDSVTETTEQIIEVAPAPVIRTEKTEEFVEIPYETVYEYSDRYYTDERIVKREGANGKALRVTVTTYEDETVVDSSVTETVISKAMESLVIVGTKAVLTYQTKNVTENIVPYTTETREDDNRYDDETTVIREGINGYTTATYQITYEKGYEIHRICTAKNVTAPISEIISVGTIPAWTVETETVREKTVAYKTTYIYDNTLASGTRIVKTEGKNGYTESVYEIKYYRGKISSRKAIQSTVYEPTNEVIVVGTKKEEKYGLPFESGRGYTLTQDYGNGHYAMDFGVWYGDPILAVKSGTVIYAYNDGDFPTSDPNWTYGTFVVIEHEDGVRSYYAHLKSRTVRIGDKVSGGDVIGYSGNTGRVNPAPTASDPYAGTHLHFEIREKQNGSYVKVDPKKYIPY